MILPSQKKIIPEIRMFMDPESLRDCILSLMFKNLEDYDRIPQRVLVDRMEHLIQAFSDTHLVEYKCHQFLQYFILK